MEVEKTLYGLRTSLVAWELEKDDTLAKFHGGSGMVGGWGRGPAHCAAKRNLKSEVFWEQVVPHAAVYKFQSS